MRPGNLGLFVCTTSMLLGLLLVGSARAEELWRTYHGDRALRGVSSVVLPDAPVLRWRYQAAAGVYNPPVTDGKQIYFCDDKGGVVALDLAGQRVWSRTLKRKLRFGNRLVPEQFTAPPSVFRDLVLVGSESGSLYAFRPDNGETVWKTGIDGPILGAANLVPGEGDRPDRITVIDQSIGTVHALDLRTGVPVWEAEGLERTDGSAAVMGPFLVFGSCLAALHVYNAETGQHLRNIPMPEEAEIAGGTSGEGNSVFVGTRLGHLIHADIETGQILWTRWHTEAEAFSTPAVGADLVVFSVDDDYVYGLQRRSGEVRWRFLTAGLPTCPVLAADKVAVTASGFLYLLRAVDGTLVWSREISDEISSPAVINGMLVVGADDGTVSAYGNQPE